MFAHERHGLHKLSVTIRATQGEELGYRYLLSRDESHSKLFWRPIQEILFKTIDYTELEIMSVKGTVPLQHPKSACAAVLSHKTLPIFNTINISVN